MGVRLKIGIDRSKQFQGFCLGPKWGLEEKSQESKRGGRSGSWKRGWHFYL